MSTVTFPCPFCAQPILVDAAEAEVSCPHAGCGKRVTVPGARAPLGQPAAAAPADPAAVDSGILSTKLTRVGDRLLGLVRFLRERQGLFASYLRLLSTIGVYGIVAGGLLFAIQFTIVAIQRDRMNIFGLAVAGLILALVMHYVASRFVLAGPVLLKRNPEGIAGTNFLDCMGFLAGVGALLALLGGSWVAIQAREGGPFMVGLFLFLVLAHVALFALNPVECLNIAQDARKRRAGETALAVLHFFARGGLALGPVLVAVAAAVGSIWTIVNIIRSLAGDYYIETDVSLFTLDATGLLLWAGVLPLLAWLWYLFVVLAIELCQAILGLSREESGG